MNKDTNILRELVKTKKELANKSVNKQRIDHWHQVNDLKTEKPTVLITQLPWHEMNVDNELTLQCNDPFHRRLEDQLRKEIYTYRHFPGDRIMPSHIDSPVAVNDSGFGIEEQSDKLNRDRNSDTPSRHFIPQIRSMEDIHKIKDPIITRDDILTEDHFNHRQELFGDLIDIKKTGSRGWWFTPWDNLICLTGVQEAMMDLILQPEYVDRLVERFVDASISRLHQYLELGLWGSNNTSVSVGSGGYGYTHDLAPSDGRLHGASTSDMWGCGNAQVFSEVSPQMHWDFSLKHELRWLKEFGLTYYGCCEPLSGKFDILSKIPNLRKISISPWADLEASAEQAKNKYVLSIKPNPAIFATDSFDEDYVKKELIKTLDQTKGCAKEIILKDITTVRYQAQKVWRYAELVKETIDQYYN